MKPIFKPLFLCSSFCMLSQYGHTEINLYQSDDTKIDAVISVTAGMFHSQKNYIPTENTKPYHWQEAYIDYGIQAEQKLKNLGHLYGKLSFVSAGTFGDGDAAGFTNGTERGTKIEDAYIGWKSAELFPSLGENGLDISLGRQNICLGDGFLICTDAPNVGDSPIFGSEFNRNSGGTYYLAGHKSFKDTILIKIGPDEGLKATLATFKSNNAFQAYSKFYAATLDWNKQLNKLNFTYLHNKSVDQYYAEQVGPTLVHRKGMNVYSVNGTSPLGLNNTEFAFQYALQDKKHVNNENAWYAQAKYTFNDTKYTPSISYRYLHFSENWDNLFIGAADYGTWFQGEVAYNYSGPFNSNTKISNIGFNIHPSEKYSFGAQYYHFSTLVKQNNPNFNGQELDLYMMWFPNQKLTIAPLIGIYKPQASAMDGGSQNKDNRTNFYAQLVMNYNF